MPKNLTNQQRAARELAQRDAIPYAKALQLIRTGIAPEVPEPSRIEVRYGVTISDAVGRTDDEWGTADLWPEMADAVATDPTAGFWEGDTWTLSLIDNSTDGGWTCAECDRPILAGVGAHAPDCRGASQRRPPT